jgi:Major Facilitator Superfamily
VPVGLALLTLAPRVVARDKREPGRAARRLDLAGLAVAVPAVFLIVFPLVLGHQEGWPWWVPAGIGAGLVLAACFVWLERQVAARGGDPLLDLGVFGSPGFGSGLGALVLAMVAYGGWLFSLSLHLQSGLGDSALRAGLTFAPSAAAFGLCGFYWRKLPERFHHLLTPLGFAVTAAAEVVLGLYLRSGAHGGPTLPLVLLVLGAGLGTGYSPLVTHALARVPPADAAGASGLFTTSLQLGQVIGVATFGSLFLSLAVKTASAAHSGTRAGLPSSSHAIAVTSGWLAALFAVALLAALPLARAVAGARRRARSA